MHEETPLPAAARERLLQGIATGRVHSAYLFAGAGEAPRATAQWFMRALVCAAEGAERPCEACAECRRSTPLAEPPAIDGAGKKGGLLRHVGNHPGLVWVERGAGDTRVRIGQVRAVQEAFHLRGTPGQRRAACIADAEWLNQQAQNSLLRLLEEPPPLTSVVLVSSQPSGLLATVRSRCSRVNFSAVRRPSPFDAEASDHARKTAQRLGGIGRLRDPELLDWAEEFRGPRAAGAPALGEWLADSAAWLNAITCRAAGQGENTDSLLAAWSTLQEGRKALVQRNANPQMVAERVLFALRDALAAAR